MAEHRRVHFCNFLFICFSFVLFTQGQDLDNHNGPVRNQGGGNFGQRNAVIGNDVNPKLAEVLRNNPGMNGFRQDNQMQRFPQQQQQAQQLLQGQQQQQGPLRQAIQQGVNQFNNARDGLKNELANAAKLVRGGSHGPSVRLVEHPDCQEDVQYFCSDTRKNNFQIIACLQSTWDENSKREVSLPCQHMVWSYKKNLTMDLRFDNAASQVCQRDIEQLSECRQEQPGTGKRIACLIEHKENISAPGCIQFVKKMADIVFSDYRLIADFADKCESDILRLSCGRLEPANSEVPHQQGKVISCLSEQVASLSPDCKQEILHVAELQSDDFHQDRALYYACKSERDRLCGNVKSGGGAIYKCLFRHKFEKTMSAQCRHELTRRQVLMEEDVKVNRGLFASCRQDIKKNKCFHLEGTPKMKEARQSTVILCLEQVMKDGVSVEPECIAQVKEVRRSLMEDYKINPELVRDCQHEIQQECDGGLERGGQTMHCLMDLARRNDKTELDKKMSSKCRRALDDVLLEADVGEAVNVDPILKAACGTFMMTACSDFVKDNEGMMMDCLMDKVGSKDMPEECEERIMEIQYFIARDFRLDSRLYKFCKTDAVALCSDGGQYRNDVNEDMTPERGPLTFACLYRHVDSPQPELQLSRPCTHEVQRVLRQRALSVELNPRIQMPCMGDLTMYCSDKTKPGQEMRCLQDQLDMLSPACQKAVANFTQDQDKDYRMDKKIMMECTPMIKRFCSEVVENADTHPEDVMECLIKHKREGDMNPKCRAEIEHHQLITLKDYRFSFKFKEACKQDVLRLCQRGVKTKSDVVRCLSTSVRNDTLLDKPHRISQECRSQLSFELLQRGESIRLDPVLEESCHFDIDTHCSNVSPGGGAVLQCLRKHEKELNPPCKKLLFAREEEEGVNIKGDFVLYKQCKSMIKQYCNDRQPGKVFKCLKEHKSEEDFDHNCKKVVIDRLRERANDVRLNAQLMAACKADISKFCEKEMNEIGKSDLIREGKVMGCLRDKFSKKRLSQPCEDHVGGVIKESNLDYKQDVLLARACQQQIREFCMDKIVAQDMDDHGQVEECLKEKLAESKITDPHCVIQIARVLAESKADVHVDPVLYRTCAMDIKHFCEGVPRGEGRQMSCLLSGLGNSKVHLTKDCMKMLEERKEMWEHAAKAAPAESFNDLAGVLIDSPSRNYFMSMMLLFIGCLFFCGICCGRVSKRVRQDMKNR